MATTCYFEEVIIDQDGDLTIEVEFGRSSFYNGAKLSSGNIGTDSIYLTVNGKMVVMDRATAKKFVEAAVSVGEYHGLLD